MDFVFILVMVIIHVLQIHKILFNKVTCNVSFSLLISVYSELHESAIFTNISNNMNRKAPIKKSKIVWHTRCHINSSWYINCKCYPNIFCRKASYVTPLLIVFYKGNCSPGACVESMYKRNEVSFINLLSSQLNSHGFILSFPLALLCSFL